MSGCHIHTEGIPAAMCREPLWGGTIMYKQFPKITIPADIALHNFSVSAPDKNGEYTVWVGFQHRSGSHYNINFPCKNEAAILVITDKHLQAAQVAGHNPF